MGLVYGREGCRKDAAERDVGQGGERRGREKEIERSDVGVKKGEDGCRRREEGGRRREVCRKERGGM